jgi:hypothetical protein
MKLQNQENSFFPSFDDEPVGQQPRQCQLTPFMARHVKPRYTATPPVWNVPRCSVWRSWARAGWTTSMATWPGPAISTTNRPQVVRRRRGRGHNRPPHSSCSLSPSSIFLQDRPVVCSRHPSILSTAIWRRIFSYFDIHVKLFENK